MIYNMGVVWSTIQNIINYRNNNNVHLLNKPHNPKDVFKYMLEEREKYASDYINLLYFDGLNTITELKPYLQWHKINECTELVDLYKFIGLNIEKQKKGSIQAWDLEGISKVDKYQLYAPIEIVSERQLLDEGFDCFQIESINGVIKMLHSNSKINKSYTYGLVMCSIYEDVLYIVNSKITFNEKTKKSDQYKENELTQIYLEKDYGNNNINYNNIIDIIRQIVYVPSNYSKVVLNFNKTEYINNIRNIEDFMNENVFMSKEEVFKKYPGIFPKLNKNNVKITLSKNGVLAINIPEMFFVGNKFMKKMVVVPSTNNNIYNKKLNKIKQNFIYASNDVLLYYNNNNIDIDIDIIDNNTNDWMKIDIN